MQPKVAVYLDVNSPYSLLSAVRIYQIHNTDVEARKQTLQHPLSSTDITHPAISKVKFELKPIDYFTLVRNGKSSAPSSLDSGRGKYIMLDLTKTLKRLGTEEQFVKLDTSCWPQQTSFTNAIASILLDRNTFDNAAKEVIGDYKPENYDSKWRDTQNEFGSTLEDAISSEYIFRVSVAIFIEHKQTTEESVQVEILDKILAKYPAASNGLGGSKTIIELAKKSKIVEEASFRPTQDAMDSGIFGIPTFVDERDNHFWGNDHLVDAAIVACETQKN
ncbi:hypothetical protein BB559_001451 [Furculomyces boomerangus]|uniref:DSBA-like thioredoxin domain-containing protein n=2 Tax=Harpellales TaxID=61421 RepID=A0A2T9Z222_9FUNG|nr:hypothetical protein BB559_001451 [Furculomyces boomerangus]PWA03554.1 hypothetical protein BB558_000242 [Smittium angustum]